MLGKGVEPSRDCSQGILSPQCLPFHHPSMEGKSLKYLAFEVNHRCMKKIHTMSKLQTI